MRGEPGPAGGVTGQQGEEGAGEAGQVGGRPLQLLLVWLLTANRAV